MSGYIHPTAILEDRVVIGEGTSVWDSVHIRCDTRVGKAGIIGEKTHISYGVSIGDFVKINAFVYICTAVTVEDGVMLSAGCTFTNDLYPRAADPELKSLRDSNPDENTRPTVVRCGATVGAGAVIGCGITIGRFAMVGMGAIVTRSVPDFHLVLGNPARTVGYVCRCGHPVLRFRNAGAPEEVEVACSACGREYRAAAGRVVETFREGVRQQDCAD